MKMIEKGTYTIKDGILSFKGYTFDCAGDDVIDMDEVARLIIKNGRPNTREL